MFFCVLYENIDSRNTGFGTEIQYRNDLMNFYPKIPANFILFKKQSLIKVFENIVPKCV